MKFFYTAGIYLMDAGMRLAALFNRKARLWAGGQKHILRRMAQQVGEQADVAWFHAASLGEFEQGRPVIEAFREANPGYKILLTFFSPSGYEVRKNYGGADYIFYLPSDTPHNVRRFIRIVRPRIAVFIKYEFWVNYLLALQRSGARVYLISAIFRPGQSFFKWHGGLFRRALKTFDHIFVQNGQSLDLLRGIGIERVSVAGDTRFDRVADIAEQARTIPAVERFSEGHEVLVAGSTWPQDEQLLLQMIGTLRDVRFIIAPHEIDSERIERLIGRIDRPCLRYTRIGEASDPAAAEVLFIDTIGILSSVYRYGRYGYIGGGFGAGIHNTLEAAVFGLPLAFGPNYEKFQEARDLIAQGGAVSVSDAGELEAWLTEMRGDPERYRYASGACSGYILGHKGATGEIMREICR